MVCVISGLLFIGDLDIISQVFTETWAVVALILGIIFLLTFYLMAITTQKFSISVATISSKISLAIPVAFSLLILEIQSKEFDFFNYLGLFTSVVAIVLSSIKDKKLRLSASDKQILLLPLLVFFFSGLIDTTINFTNLRLLPDHQEALFPIVIFFSAGALGIIILITRREKLQVKALPWGLLLGIINYFSIYFLVKTLTKLHNDGAVVFPLLNLGIILFSSIASVALFRERLTRLNAFGLLLALITIVLLSHQEIAGYLNRI